MRFDFISARGERLPLANNPLFVLSKVDGQTTAAATIANNTIGGADGSVITNVQAQPRPITFDLTFRSGVDVEAAKRTIFKIVKIKQQATLEWEQNKRTVRIVGVVESVDMSRWDEKTLLQISMFCAQPFWEDAESIAQQISEAEDLHYFVDGGTDMLYFTEDGIVLGEYDTTRTKDVYNDGDVDVGMEISIVALATVTNPIIYNSNGEFFGVGYGSGVKQVVMNAGDVITISTVKGKKSVKNGDKNLLSYIKPQSTWLQLAAGNNKFTINSDDENVDNLSFSLSYKQRYI